MPRPRQIGPDGICASCRVSMHVRCGGRCACKDRRCVPDLRDKARELNIIFIDYTEAAWAELGKEGVTRFGSRYVAYVWCDKEKAYHIAPDRTRSYPPTQHSFDGTGIKGKGIKFRRCAKCRAGDAETRALHRGGCYKRDKLKTTWVGKRRLKRVRSLADVKAAVEAVPARSRRRKR